VADTLSRLTDLIVAKGMKLFGVIDQSAEASRTGLELRDTALFSETPSWPRRFATRPLRCTL